MGKKKKFIHEVGEKKKSPSKSANSQISCVKKKNSPPKAQRKKIHLPTRYEKTKITTEPNFLTPLAI